MKLETWLRAAGVKYENSFGMSRGNKGLIPFIRLNDVQVDDSQRCIEYLTEIFQIDLNSHLTREERAMSHLVIKLCDDSLLWFVFLLRMHSFGVFVKWSGKYLILRTLSNEPFLFCSFFCHIKNS